MKATIYDEDAALITNITRGKYLDLNDNGVGLKKRFKSQLEFYKECKKNLIPCF